MDSQLLTVLIASGVGVIVCLLLTIDAVQDVRANNRNTPDRDKIIIVNARVVREAVTLTVEFMWLLAAVIVGTTVDGTYREHVVWILIAIPIILAGGSIYGYIQKQRLLQGGDKDEGKETAGSGRATE